MGMWDNRICRARNFGGEFILLFRKSKLPKYVLVKLNTTCTMYHTCNTKGEVKSEVHVHVHVCMHFRILNNWLSLFYFS